ncbi:MAG: hypothetical protein IIA54_04970, partial [Chloroflexi bacterium]|nr:hypothetical protein [Chloroflexota bacterium]
MFQHIAIDWKGFVRIDPNPVYVVSIGDNAQWTDAGNYPQLIDFYKWQLFSKEGRNYSGWPGPEVKQIDTYIDPKMVEEGRITFPSANSKYALINSSI